MPGIMNRKTFTRRSSLCLAGAASLFLAQCGKPAGTASGGGTVPKGAVQAGKFIVLEAMTDQTDRAVAKQNCETALAKNEDLAAVTGLWSYNTPQCLEALKAKGKLGKVKVFAFDEEAAVLDAIAQGHAEGTIVQQPYQFGYQSMKYLKDLADGKEVQVGPDKVVAVPAVTITKENLAEFRATMEKQQADGRIDSPPPAPGAPKFAFVINNMSPFWLLAKAGLRKAEAEFGLVADFQAPSDGSVNEQNRILSSIVSKGDYKGVAISPVDAANQTQVLNDVAAKLPLVTQDSDAPKSNRRFYVGTNNVEAGRLLAKLIKTRMPDGGKIAVFVGSMDAQNARERYQGLVEELKQP